MDQKAPLNPLLRPNTIVLYSLLSNSSVGGVETTLQPNLNNPQSGSDIFVKGKVGMLRLLQRNSFGHLGWGLVST